MENKKKSAGQYYRKVGMLVFVPFIWVAAPGVGFVIGNLLDGLFKTGYILSVIFVFLGMGAAARETYMITKRVSRENS